MVTLYSKHTRALTFENVCHRPYVSTVLYVVTLYSTKTLYSTNMATSREHHVKTIKDTIEQDCLNCLPWMDPVDCFLLGLFCLYIRSLFPLQQVSFSSIINFFASAAGLFCLYIRSLLPSCVSVTAAPSLHSSRSLLSLQQVSLPLK
jgi:hypothetical protein